MKISIDVFEDADKWLRENLGDIATDNVACVVPVGPFRPGETMKYLDKEENVTLDRTWDDHIQALRLLCDQIAQRKLFVGGIKSPLELTDPGNWDAEVADAYFQLVYRGEVIYG